MYLPTQCEDSQTKSRGQVGAISLFAWSSPHVHVLLYMSQFKIRDEGNHGVQVQIHRSKMELMKRIPSVRFDQLEIFFISDTG
jgi:hypothetical protein